MNGDSLRPYRALKIFSNLIQGWRDLQSLTPGYYLQPLRGWLSEAFQRQS
jgi:hypothetical protein